ncbi:hypothetical protein [Escherichia coli]|uniref:hypothetical protein n=1 Tax=Escherichia coli TaxID=562 RepID=UPI0005CE4931|nr:hypothetical protein [Escherichia coli]
MTHPRQYGPRCTLTSPSPPTENESKEKQKSRQCHPLTANAGSRDYGIQALLKMPDNIPASPDSGYK